MKVKILEKGSIDEEDFETWDWEEPVLPAQSIVQTISIAAAKTVYAELFSNPHPSGGRGPFASFNCFNKMGGYSEDNLDLSLDVCLGAEVCLVFSLKELTECIAEDMEELSPHRAEFDGLKLQLEDVVKKLVMLERRL